MMTTRLNHALQQSWQSRAFNRRNLVLSALLLITLAITVSAAAPSAESQDQAYREYLEGYNKMEEANRKYAEAYNAQVAAYQRKGDVTFICLMVVFAGVFVWWHRYVALPAINRAQLAVEIAKQQQKTLEEIRDLLKK